MTDIIAPPLARETQGLSIPLPLEVPDIPRLRLPENNDPSAWAEHIKSDKSGAISIDEGPFLWRATTHILISSSREYLLEVVKGQTMCRVTDLDGINLGIVATRSGFVMPIDGCEAIPEREIIHPGDTIPLIGVSRISKQYDPTQRFSINWDVKSILYLPLTTKQSNVK